MVERVNTILILRLHEPAVVSLWAQSNQAAGRIAATRAYDTGNHSYRNIRAPSHAESECCGWL